MTKEFKTKQEEFLAGEFGNEYIKRNQGRYVLAANLDFFSKSLTKIGKMQSYIEFGANIGNNLQALKLLYPDHQQFAIEINSSAVNELLKFMPETNVFQTSILDFEPSNIAGGCDVAIIKGVLIHINPEFLTLVYPETV